MATNIEAQYIRLERRQDHNLQLITLIYQYVAGDATIIYDEEED